MECVRCQNVNIWCEFQIFSFVPILELNGNVFAPCSEFWCESVTNTSHFWCENVTNLVPDRYNKKWFGAKTRYFFGRKRDVLYCQNVNIWCEFQIFSFVPILELNGNIFAPCSEFWCDSVTNTSHFWRRPA